MEVLKSMAQSKELQQEQPDLLSFDVHTGETEKETNTPESPYMLPVK